MERNDLVLSVWDDAEERRECVEAASSYFGWPCVFVTIRDLTA